MTSTPNAFVSMDHLRRWARSALLATLAIVVGSVALGEQKKAGVQVDLSVLEEMGPRKPVSSSDRIVVRRPGEAGPGQAARPAQAAVPLPASPRPAPPVPAAGQPTLGSDFPAMRASDEPIEEAIAAVTAEEEATAAPAIPAETETAPVAEPEAEPVAEEPAASSEAALAEEPADETAAVTEAASEPPPAEEPLPAGEATVAQEEPAAVAVTEPLETVQVEPRPALGPVDQVEPAEDASAQSDESPAPEAEQAARPPAAEEGSFRVLFAPGSADLSDEADDALESLADRMNDDPALRIELLAYAPAEEIEERLARRLSLSRALAIRLYLPQEGIAGTRTLVRALGSNGDEGPPDRVDIVLASE